MGYVDLAQALALLREELGAAQDAGHDHQFRFEIAEAEIEFLVQVVAEGSANGQLKLGVVSIGAGGKTSRADTHTLRLKLNPKDAATGGRNLEVRRDETRTWDE